MKGLSKMRTYIVLLCLLLLGGQAFAAESPVESAYSRVVRTGVLRCGYTVIPPELARDPNTGAISGLVPDIMKEIGQRLNLRIEWTEETTFPSMGAGLENGRYDAICFSLYRLAAGARAMHYTHPLFFSRTSVYVRMDDDRFAQIPLERLNKPDVTIAVIDGEMAQRIAVDQFPQAKTFSMPQSTDLAQMLLSVATGKADVAFVNDVVASGYLKANPGQLKTVALPEPLRLFSHGLAVGPQETALGNMLDTALDEMQEQGIIDRLLTRHELLPHSYLRIAKPYDAH